MGNTGQDATHVEKGNTKMGHFVNIKVLSSVLNLYGLNMMVAILNKELYVMVAAKTKTPN